MLRSRRPARWSPRRGSGSAGSSAAPGAIARRWRWPPDRRGAALADHGVVAVRLADDELVRVGHAAGPLHLVIGRAGLADQQVVPDRAVEQQAFLEHHADVGAQAVQGDVAQVLPVDGDAAGGRVPQALQQ